MTVITREATSSEKMHTDGSILCELLANSTIFLQSTTLVVSCLACNMLET